jgi:hypothetical protein
MNEEIDTPDEVAIAAPVVLSTRPMVRLYPGIRWSDLVAEMDADLERRDAA